MRAHEFELVYEFNHLPLNMGDKVKVKANDCHCILRTRQREYRGSIHPNRYHGGTVFPPNPHEPFLPIFVVVKMGLE